ncbi:TetR/AcrR family transcriptional regulator [Mycoplasmatota bacterium]|nr:TetR/AcrR family transcriptional regulator [Mycoplasmatota bacterium]
MQNTKDKILDSVVSYIKEEPTLSHISMVQIAQRAGIGKSTIYDYFETKDSLIEETYVYLLDKYQKILLRDINMTSFKETMILQLSWILEVVEDAKVIMEAILSSQNELIIFNYKHCSKKIELIQKKMQKRFNKIFSLGMDELIINKTLHPYSTNIIQALISGLMFQYIDNKIDITRSGLIDLIYQELIKVLN